MGLESKFWNKLGFILILAHFPATWELKIWKFSNFGQNHFSDFETPFLAGLEKYGTEYLDIHIIKYSVHGKHCYSIAADVTLSIDGIGCQDQKLRPYI